MRDRPAIAPEDTWTLSSVPNWGYLVGLCGGCGHEAPLDPRKLWVRHGRAARLKALGPLLRCQKCGNKRFNSIGVKPKPR